MNSSLLSGIFNGCDGLIAAVRATGSSRLNLRHLDSPNHRLEAAVPSLGDRIATISVG